MDVLILEMQGKLIILLKPNLMFSTVHLILITFKVSSAGQQQFPENVLTYSGSAQTQTAVCYGGFGFGPDKNHHSLI